MARSHARIALSIWADRDFLALPIHAQWLYLSVISQENINHAGVIALSPKRWAALCSDRDPKLVDDALDVLTERRFVVVDHDTEQLLVRSFIRNDGVAGQPNTLKNACASVLLVTSRPIRKALLGELLRLDQARIAAMRTTPGHEPAISVLLSTIADLRADEPPPDDHATTPSDGYASDGYDSDGYASDPFPRTRAGEGAGEGVGEAPVSRLVDGWGGKEPPAPRRPGSRNPGPGQQPLIAAAPAPAPDPAPTPDRCPRCSRLGLAPDDPGPACKGCEYRRKQREQRAAGAAASASRVGADRRAATAACGWCDDVGWRREYPDGPPVEPAIRCDHRPVQAVTQPRERLA